MRMILFALVAVAAPSAAQAQSSSLLYRTAPRGTYDTRAVSLTYVPVPDPIKLHDLINIDVQESTQQLANARTNRQRRNAFELSLDDFIVLLNGLRLRADQGVRADEPGIDINSTFNLQSNSQFSRVDQLRFSIQVEVVEIKPNGNLVVEGYKVVAVNNEQSTYKISGIVSIRDVDLRRRSVPSSKVHRSRVELEQVGPTRDSIKRGWLVRFIDMFNPF